MDRPARTLDYGQLCSDSMISLRMAREGQWVRIVSIKGGGRLHERLAGVGLRVGVKIQVLHNAMDGKLMLGHQGTRLYMGGGMAHKIQVVQIKGACE